MADPSDSSTDPSDSTSESTPGRPDSSRRPRALPTRRALLAAGLAGGASALTFASTSFASSTGAADSPPSARGPETRTVSGHLDPGAADYVYLPIEVPRGVERIDVSYSYDRPSVAAGALGNSCDIGIFDERGIDLGGRGFRGWSGGFRTEFSIAADAATPGYLPGRIRPGTWHVVLGPYQVSQQGLDFSVDVTLTYGTAGTPAVPAYPPRRIAGTGAGWYRGDCHLHTVYSDGKRLPAEVAAGARAAGLDFMVTTDHNTSSSHGVWGPLAGDDLLIITGEEITTRNGHCLALGLPPGEWVDWRYRSRDEYFPVVARQIHHGGGIVVPAHPYCAYVACRWKFGYEHADAVEVWNGPWTADDESAVDTWDSMLVDSSRRGTLWLPAMGNSDAHSEPQVIGLPHTVVRSDSVSRDDLLTGIRRGRSWIAESAQVRLSFTAANGMRTVDIGDRLAGRPLDPVTVTAVVSGVPNGVVRFVSDEGQVQQTSLPPSGVGTVSMVTTPSLAAFVRCEVRHPMADGTPGNGAAMGPRLQLGPMAAMTNPIWLGRRDAGL